MKKRTLSEAAATGRRIPLHGQDTISVTATEAQNEFGRILDTVAQDRVVIVTRHNAPKAVIMSISRYDALARSDSDTTMLDTLSAEFDAWLAKMQTPEVRAATRRAFESSPEELREAAMEAAREREG
jgi:prevent-host-death family protein